MRGESTYSAQILLRPAIPPDARQIARVDVDTWRATYRGILPPHYLAGLSYQAREDNWRALIASRSHGQAEITLVVESYLTGEVVGFASGGPTRERDSAYRGELYTLYLCPDQQRLGLGRRLISKVAQHLASRQMRSMLVWVLAENPACRFYASCGGKLLGTRTLWLGGLPVEAAAYGWSDTKIIGYEAAPL